MGDHVKTAEPPIPAIASIDALESEGSPSECAGCKRRNGVKHGRCLECYTSLGWDLLTPVDQVGGCSQASTPPSLHKLVFLQSGCYCRWSWFIPLAPE
jgi:hypothetical protein